MEEIKGVFTDLHIHSRFSQACSRSITFDNLVKWARIKGLNLLGTGDFTHPLWFNEIKEKLKSNGKGLYFYQDFPFIITGEISFIYTQESQEALPLASSSASSQRRGRRIHLVVLVPDIETAEKINNYFDGKGRRDYDGRPIFKISGEQFVEDMMKISKEIEIIPAHIWTPWFGLFGSMSGFDSLKECFGEQIKNIHAIETGMSSDPEMNWRIKELVDNGISIVSFSDAHSFWPFRLGREATIFKNTESYKEIIEQIRNNDFISTIEVDPAYGKYHWDGHRNCNFSSSPQKTKQIGGICPVCRKPLTIGVESRVEDLAENPEGFKPEAGKSFFTILPLQEIIVLAEGGSLQNKKIWDVYNSLIEKFGNEINILLTVSREEFIKEKVDEKLVELILRNRNKKIKVNPGYDGEYGVAVLEEKQRTLF